MRPRGWRAVIIICQDSVVFFVSWVHQINAVTALWEPSTKCKSVLVMLLHCVWMCRTIIRWGCCLGWWILYLRLWRYIWCILAKYRMAQALTIDRRGIFIDVVLKAWMNLIEVLGQSTSAFELSIASWTENKQQSSLERLFEIMKELIWCHGCIARVKIVILKKYHGNSWGAHKISLSPVQLCSAHIIASTSLSHYTSWTSLNYVFSTP